LRYYYSIGKVLSGSWLPLSDTYLYEDHSIGSNFILLMTQTARHFAGLQTSRTIMLILFMWSGNANVFSFYLINTTQVEMRGFEPLASAVQRRRSPN
jgi:hypothetical protein